MLQNLLKTSFEKHSHAYENTLRKRKNGILRDRKCQIQTYLLLLLLRIKRLYATRKIGERVAAVVPKELNLVVARVFDPN